MECDQIAGHRRLPGVVIFPGYYTAGGIAHSQSQVMKLHHTRRTKNIQITLRHTHTHGENVKIMHPQAKQACCTAPMHCPDRGFSQIGGGGMQWACKQPASSRQRKSAQVRRTPKAQPFRPRAGDAFDLPGRRASLRGARRTLPSSD